MRTRSGRFPAGLVVITPVVAALWGLPAAAAEVTSAADGTLEIRERAAVLARVPLKTPPLRRGAPALREVSVSGHRVVELRVPVRGTAAEEVWVGELGAAGAPKGTAKVIWSGLAGPRDADQEHGVAVEVTSARIIEYQTSTQVSRCDGEPARLFPHAWDFSAGRFRPIVSPPPAPARQKLVGRRGDPAMPAGRPLGGFHWVGASTSAGAGRDARNIAAPVALNDGDPATVWTEGLGGDGRGELLTARPTTAGYRVRGLRIFPGDGSSEQAFRGRNRVRGFQLAFGPEPEKRFDVDLGEDPAADPKRWREPYWVPLPEPIAASCVTLILTDVVRGTQASPPADFGTTAIGDVDVFTELDGPQAAERLVADVAGSVDCASRLGLLVAMGEPAVLPTAQAVLTAKGSGRECLVEALAKLAPAPTSPIVTDALVSALSGATPKEETLILAALRASPSPPVPGLERLLNDSKRAPDDRARAARALGSLKDPAAGAVLLAAAGHGPDPVRAAVVRAIGGSEAVTPSSAIAALSGATTQGTARRADLVRALAPVARRHPDQTSAVLDALRGALRDPEFVVRGRALMGMGELGAASALGDLIAVRSTSDDPVLRYLATRELAKVGGPNATTALRQALKDRDPRVRETAARGLGTLLDRGFADELAKSAVDEPWPFVRRAEMEALGKLCTPSTAGLLVRAGQQDVDEVRRAALVSLVKCRDPRTKTLLLRTLGRRNERATVRELSASLLGELGDRSVAAPMAAALKRLVTESEADLALEGVAAATLRALGRLGGPPAVEAAATLARDTKHPFRKAAVEVLGQLCDPGPGAAALREVAAGKDAQLALTAQAAEKHCASRAGGP